MTTKNLQTLSVLELTGLYEKAGTAYGEALEHGTAKAANKQYDVIAALEKEFKRRGSEGQEAVLRAMSHESRWVRLLAAGFTLHFDPPKAVPVLQEITLLRGTCGFTAGKILELWREGRLPPEE